MKDKITVIITIRNRESWRIEDQVRSIHNAGAYPSFHIVDYGSDEVFVNQYKDVCQKLNLQYTHMYAEGLPWNKCHAINYGARTAKTPFIVTSDVDMIYEGNPFQWCLDNYVEKTMYHLETYWLPKNGKIKNAQYAGHENSGGFQFIAQSAFKELGGYDERIVYWGPEDLDWPGRLKKIGYTQIWLPKEYKIFHQYHKPSEKGYLSPENAASNALKNSLENFFTPILTNPYGLPIQKDSRPILTQIEKEIPYEMNIKTNNLSHWCNLNVLLESKQHKFVKFLIQPRLRKFPLDFIRFQIKKILKPIAFLTGTVIDLNKNENFDFFYDFLPILQKNGLVDFYFSKTLDTIYLLW